MSDISRRAGLKLGLAAIASVPLIAATATRAQAATHEVIIADFKFTPKKLEVAIGDTVVFRNKDRAPHTATARNGSFDTGNLRRGKSAEVTISSAGTIDYKCTFHPSMKGAIIAS